MSQAFGQPQPQVDDEVEYWSHAEALKRDAAAAAAAAKAALPMEEFTPPQNARHWRRTPVGQMELLVNQANRTVRRALRLVDKLNTALALALPIPVPATAASSAKRTAGAASRPGPHSVFAPELVTALVVHAGAAWQGVVLRLVILQEAVTAYVRVAEAHKLVQATEQTRVAAPTTPKSKTQKARPEPEETKPISEVERARRMRRVVNMSPEPEAWGYPPGTRLAYGDAPHTVRLMTPEEMETTVYFDSSTRPALNPTPEVDQEQKPEPKPKPTPEPEPPPVPVPSPRPKCPVAFMETEPEYYYESDQRRRNHYHQHQHHDPRPERQIFF